MNTKRSFRNLLIIILSVVSCFIDIFNFYIIIEKQMSNINTATYIKKLVKMVYEKQNQIEGLKKQLRTASTGYFAGASREVESMKPIEETIKHELYLTSSQLKEVTLQMNVMESKMVELQLGLEEEIVKNNELQGQIAALREENARIKDQKNSLQKLVRQLQEENNSYGETIFKNKIEFEEISQQVRSLFESLDVLKSSEEVLRSEKNGLIIEINEIRQREVKESVQRLEIEKQVSYSKFELLQKQSQIQLKEAEIAQKIKVIEQKESYNYEKNHEIDLLNHELSEIRTSHKNLQDELQAKSNQLELKLRQNHHLGESLKDYQEFSFQISKYIQSAYIKHCCQGLLRSSKKLTKETERTHSMFESSFKKMTQIQNWMDDTAEKLQQYIHEQAIPEQTLENISIIARSFAEKLELCDLTERIQKENEQFIRNQEELINNLQKDCEKSYQRERSHIVELGQMKEVLKMTKDVNRELLEQVNQRDCVISECKKIYEKCLPRNSQEFHLMKRVLDQI